MILPGLVLPATTGLALYTYIGYPAILKVLSLMRRPTRMLAEGSWPRISIMVPVYNEEGVIAATLERILAADYPADRRQILVVSDASTDATSWIAVEFGLRTIVRPRNRGHGGNQKSSSPLAWVTAAR